MQDKVIVSIIVPCYNAKEEWVKRALLSVRNQTYKSYELIVVDDGSSKAYHDILVSLVTENNEHLITIKNSGVSAARNIAVQSAKGDFICFLDVDDWLEPDYLERALLFQSKSNADFVIGGTVMCSDYIIHDAYLLYFSLYIQSVENYRIRDIHYNIIMFIFRQFPAP